MMETTFWARGDNASANNPALNPTGDPALEISFVPSENNGDILLDYNMGEVDPDTLVTIGGASYQFSFQLSADLPAQNRNGANQVPDQYEGSTVFLIDVQDYPSAGENARLFFLPDGNATQAEMDSFGNGAIALQNIDTTTTGIICFGRGTLIATPYGDRAVESLKIGDEVETYDNGPMPILWISHSRRVWPGSPDCEKPVQIKAGVLGHGLPLRDLVVSPQHRMLLNGALLEGEDVFVPAKGLTGLPGIRIMSGKRDVTYYHVLLQSHEILTGEGALSESFYPGKQARRMLSLSQRIALARLVPTSSNQDPDTAYGPLARRSLSVKETKELACKILERGLTFPPKWDHLIAA
ncbi:Hint domain-containing protein [Roseovarius sp. D0-M9]|uniref:Hint domain-containing protein n=1 Tax=Roseovarius sp. D0-M9 TaxID=3127117 RepID=UPI0030103309